MMIAVASQEEEEEEEVRGLSRHSDSEPRPAIAKTCALGPYVCIGDIRYPNPLESGVRFVPFRKPLRSVEKLHYKHAIILFSKQFSQTVVRKKTRVRLYVTHFLP